MKLAYLDSSVWIARTEGLAVYREILQDRLEKLSTDGWLFCISDAVLLEVLPKPYKDQNYSVLTIYNKLFEQTKVLKNFPRVFENALLIAQSEHLKAMDAIHLALAVHHGCKRFVSTDPHFKNLGIILPVWIDLRTS